jgi:hypothetical protein
MARYAGWRADRLWQTPNQLHNNWQEADVDVDNDDTRLEALLRRELKIPRR